jgi:hypothetical protein
MRLFMDNEACDDNIKVNLNNVVSRYGPLSVTYSKTNRKYLDHINKYQHYKEDCTMVLS